ncbi:MAG: hypothetical protein LBQ81_00710 [Zoogloeaceae bacterium]|jgi:hypothetical protein|nr:hypothetical protein [Zoogloeaceae bacterium]
MKKIVLLIILALLLLGALIVYFLLDEPLTPLAEQALNYQPAPVPAEQNAFVGVAGLNALSRRDFLKMGEAYIQQVNLGQIEQDEQNFSYDTKDYTYSCEREITRNCLGEIQADAEKVQKLLEDEHELIQRYLKIQEMPIYSNRLRPPSLNAYLNMTLPRYDYLAYVSRILSVKAIQDIKNGRVAGGLEWIQKDMAFYRAIFAAKDAVQLDKWTALMQLQRYAILLSLLIEEDELRGQDDALRSLLASLDDLKESFENLVRSNYASALQALHKTPPDELVEPHAIVYFYYKQNMTSNFADELWNNGINIINETPIALLSSEDIVRKVVERTGCTTLGTIWGYCKQMKNHFGEALILKTYDGSDADTLLRIYDVDAHLRLVRAQLEYKLAAKPPEADPVAILAALPPETFNPYTNKPFDFDAERGVLVFQPAARPDKDKRVEIRLSKP